jgi:hypothetical protein
MEVKKKKKTDPELLRQIDSVATDNEEIQAVFSIALPMKKLLDPEQVEQTANQILERAEKEAGSKPNDVNIFRNLGSFVVSADASFIKKVIDDPDVASAIANKQKKRLLK